MQATSVHSRKKAFKAEVVVVPDAQWKQIVDYHTTAQNLPPILKPPGSTVDTATDAFWGSGDNELHLERGPRGGLHYTGDGSEVFTLCKSVEEVASLFKTLVSISGVQNIKTPYQIIKILKIDWHGKLRIEQIAYGSVYIVKGEENLASTAVAASYVEGVIHNPNYPELTFGGGGQEFFRSCSPVANLVPLAAAVAGVGLLAGILLSWRGK